ncbi:hypothetical protein ABQE45_16160 [Mycobacteroides chelonae]
MTKAAVSALIGMARTATGVECMVAPHSHTRHLRVATLQCPPAGQVRNPRDPRGRQCRRRAGVGARAVVPLLVAGVVTDAWDTAAFAMTADLPDGMRRAGVAVAGENRSWL